MWIQTLDHPAYSLVSISTTLSVCLTVRKESKLKVFAHIDVFWGIMLCHWGSGQVGSNSSSDCSVVIFMVKQSFWTHITSV